MFLNWLSKKFGNKEVKKEALKFSLIIYSDETINLDCKWDIGKEKQFAEFLYLLNNAVYLDGILKALQDKCQGTPLELSFNKVLESMKEIYKAEMEVEKEFTEIDEETTCVEPTDVFGKIKEDEE